MGRVKTTCNKHKGGDLDFAFFYFLSCKSLIRRYNKITTNMYKLPLNPSYSVVVIIFLTENYINQILHVSCNDTSSLKYISNVLLPRTTSIIQVLHILSLMLALASANRSAQTYFCVHSCAFAKNCVGFSFSV